MLAILKALLKWEDKLMGYQFKVVTDHQALELFHTQKRLSGQQMRWMEYLSCFDLEICYVKGIMNKVANMLSRYNEHDSWDKPLAAHEYVDADKHLGLEGDHLPPERLWELEENELPSTLSSGNEDEETFLAIRELKEERAQIAAEMAQAAETPLSPIQRVEGNDPTIIDFQAKGESLQKRMENVSDTFVKDIRQGYKKDPVFAKILGNPTHYP